MRVEFQKVRTPYEIICEQTKNEVTLTVIVRTHLDNDSIEIGVHRRYLRVDHLPRATTEEREKSHVEPMSDRSLVRCHIYK